MIHMTLCFYDNNKSTIKFIKMFCQRFCEIKSDCNKLCSRSFDALILLHV